MQDGGEGLLNAFMTVDVRGYFKGEVWVASAPLTGSFRQTEIVFILDR